MTSINDQLKDAVTYLLFDMVKGWLHYINCLELCGAFEWWLIGCKVFENIDTCGILEHVKRLTDVTGSRCERFAGCERFAECEGLQDVKVWRMMKIEL